LRIVEMVDLAPQQRHDLLTRLVSSHSTVMISTLDAVGEPLVAPLGYCVPMRGRLATVAITIAAVRDAGGEPELVQAAALARGELVANLTPSDLPQHLADLARAPRERATGAVRWPTTASHQVAVPSLVASRARLECRVIEPAAQPAVRDRGVARPPTGYVVIAEVVCVVIDDDLLAPPAETPERAAGRVEFPWFIGQGDRSVVDGARAHPAIEQQADRIDTRSCSWWRSTVPRPMLSPGPSLLRRPSSGWPA
jgi:flavin reductase (DIM6/NTAB) family NADH-FMN oxidoreductase RutF